MNTKEDLAYIESKIRNIPDFPEKGIQFKDITTLLSDAKALRLTTQHLFNGIAHTKPDVIVGLESRGFLFGTNLAEKLGVSFVPVRKSGKLPYKTLAQAYGLEYGTDKIEIHVDAISKGDRVIIHDDLLATGGTAKAATQLVEALGAKVIAYSFIIELDALGGRQSLPNESEIYSLIHF